ncbi:hypothetical protein P2R64_12460 [Priestia megaterium]|jgi:hypothetical protein|uniref:hypothetical protein n=1 Tax=Priestia megaterium TaxID=1404 RepID=UPI0021C09F07|nr:hypothetical protein [Priestia megaterium]MCT9852091.1 hypothetical protein [Priestia megaterium]MDF1960872.1 hypothetical protein [Priestia megaterium]
MIDNPSKIITIEDTIDMLSVSLKKFVYIYIQQRKSNPINKDDWHIEGCYEFDISVTTVNKYIKQEPLPAFQEEYRGIIKLHGLIKGTIVSLEVIM